MRDQVSFKSRNKSHFWFDSVIVQQSGELSVDHLRSTTDICPLITNTSSIRSLQKNSKVITYPFYYVSLNMKSRWVFRNQPCSLKYPFICESDSLKSGPLHGTSCTKTYESYRAFSFIVILDIFLMKGNQYDSFCNWVSAQPCDLVSLCLDRGGTYRL